MILIAHMLLHIWLLLCFAAITYELVTSADEHATLFRGNRTKEFIYISILFIILSAASFTDIRKSGQFRYLNDSYFLVFFLIYFGIHYIIVMITGSRKSFFNGPSSFWTKHVASKANIWKGISFILAAKEFSSMIASETKSVYSYFIASAG